MSSAAVVTGTLKVNKERKSCVTVFQIQLVAVCIQIKSEVFPDQPVPYSGYNQ